jgi:hypothetical protein
MLHITNAAEHDSTIWYLLGRALHQDGVASFSSGAACWPTSTDASEGWRLGRAWHNVVLSCREALGRWQPLLERLRPLGRVDRSGSGRERCGPVGLRHPAETGIPAETPSKLGSFKAFTGY